MIQLEPSNVVKMELVFAMRSSQEPDVQYVQKVTLVMIAQNVRPTTTKKMKCV